MARTLMLDLDGTLVDTVPDLAAALNRLVGRRGLAPFPVPEVKRMVGDGVAVLLRRAFAARGREADGGAVDDFMADYESHVAVQSRLFPDVDTALSGAARDGWRLAVCTNKPEQAARRLLEVVGLMPLLCAVGGGDSFPVRKPDPKHFLATLALAGGTAERAVMVGDHRNDVLCTAGTGAVSIFATWGYGTAEMAEGAAERAASITQAVTLAGQLVPA